MIDKVCVAQMPCYLFRVSSNQIPMVPNECKQSFRYICTYLSRLVQNIHKAPEPSGASHLNGIGFPVGDSESGITSEGLSTKLQV